MDFYTTLIQAINPVTGELTTYMGPSVPGISMSDAQDYCNRNGLGYCKVHGRLAGIVISVPDIKKTPLEEILEKQDAKMN